MKQTFKRLLSSILALALIIVPLTAYPLTTVAAEGSEVTVYYQNSLEWKQVYCYVWYGSGSVGKAWPGEAMTDLGNGWFKMVYKGDKPLNVVFNDNGKPKPQQTANHTPADLDITKSTYWFTNGDGKEDNPDGISGGGKITVHTAPKEGWPTAEAKVDIPDTGAGNMLTISVILLAVLATGIFSAVFFGLKRKA